jgi:hypothetical protein
MDTGGKVATGILVPLGVIGFAVGGYYLIKASKNTSHRERQPRKGSVLERLEYNKNMGFSMPTFGNSFDLEYYGGKRRTQRRRR